MVAACPSLGMQKTVQTGQREILGLTAMALEFIQIPTVKKDLENKDFRGIKPDWDLNSPVLSRDFQLCET